MANRYLSLVLLLILFTPVAFAQQIYKWKDENGQWHFSNTPAPEGEKKILPTGLLPPKEKEEEKLPPSKYDYQLNAVVRIKSSVGFGSGFFVTNGGLIVTNDHVVGSDSRVVIKIRTQKKLIYGNVVARDSARDLALVSVPAREYQWLRLGTITDAGVGTEVIAIGAPVGLEWTLTRGIISAIRDWDSKSKYGVRSKVRIVQSDAATNKGNSGGPLIGMQGLTVLGVNTFIVRKDLAEGLNFAVASEEILKAFGNHLKGK